MCKTGHYFILSTHTQVVIALAIVPKCQMHQQRPQDARLPAEGGEAEGEGEAVEEGEAEEGGHKHSQAILRALEEGTFAINTIKVTFVS